MAALDGPGFDGPEFVAADVHPQVRAFYELTAGWRLNLRSQWSAPAWPGGWLISTKFARRLGQLGLPLRPLDVAHGMTSEVTTVPSGSPCTSMTTASSAAGTSTSCAWA